MNNNKNTHTQWEWDREKMWNKWLGKKKKYIKSTTKETKNEAITVNNKMTKFQNRLNFAATIFHLNSLCTHTKATNIDIVLVFHNQQIYGYNSNTRALYIHTCAVKGVIWIKMQTQRDILTQRWRKRRRRMRRRGRNKIKRHSPYSCDAIRCIYVCISLKVPGSHVEVFVAFCLFQT